jgi:hypothetical protein
MLDYAANGVFYWSPEAIRRHFEVGMSAAGNDAFEVVSSFLHGVDVEAFWRTTKHNLQAGRIRMVFVADQIPQELRRIVEFLNGQMDPAEVIAIEVRQYRGDGLVALVPKVVGQAAMARRRSAADLVQGSKLDEGVFFESLETNQGRIVSDVAKCIYDWAKQSHLTITWAKTSFSVRLNHSGRQDTLITVYLDGKVEINFYALSKIPENEGTIGFSAKSTLPALQRKLNEIPGVNIRESDLARYPRVPLSLLEEPVQLRQFLETLAWLVDKLLGRSSREGTAEE